MDSLKIGLLGFGFMGKTHAASVVSHSGADLVAVFSAKADEPSITSMGASFHDDWRELLERDDLDAVIIATPTFTHSEIAVAAAKKGLHVFLEKPMDISVKGCNAILDAVESAGVKLAMGHVVRFDPEYSTLFAQARSGAVGTAKMIRLTRRGPAPGWGTWFFDESKSGGVILDLSIHDVDFACWLAGRQPARVTAVASPVKKEGMEVLGVCHVLLDFPENQENNVDNVDIRMAFIEGSWAATKGFPFSTSVEISGTDGLLTCAVPGKHPLEFFSDEGRVASNDYKNSPYYLEIADFIHAIRSGGEPAVTGADGLRAVRICLAALESARTGESISMEGFE